MQELYDQFEAYLKSGDKILDIGCGSGRDSRYFLSRGYDVVPVDGSMELCLLAGNYIGMDVRILLMKSWITTISLMQYGRVLHSILFSFYINAGRKSY